MEKLTNTIIWASTAKKHAGIGADSIAAMVLQVTLCHTRIRSHGLGRSTGDVEEGLGCTLTFLLLSAKTESRGQGQWMAKKIQPGFPSPRAEAANLAQHQHRQCCHSDFAIFSMCWPRQVPPPPPQLTTGHTWQHFLPGPKRTQQSKLEPLVPPYLLTISPIYTSQTHFNLCSTAL